MYIYILFITILLSHIMISTHTHVVKKLGENKFMKAFEQTLDRQHNKNSLGMLTFQYLLKIRHIPI